MKNIIALLIAMILFGQTACNQGEKEKKAEPAESPEALGSSNIQYDKNLKPLEYAGTKFKTYRLLNKGNVNPDFAKSRMTEILAMAQKKQLSFIRDTFKAPESKYIGFRRSDDASGVFEVNRITGRIVYNMGLKTYEGDFSTIGLPKEEEAVALANRYLTQLKLVDNQAELSRPMISGMEMASQKDGKASQIYKKLVTVRYNRIVDGLPVEGATRLIMSFGKNAELTSMIADWGKWEGKEVKAGDVIAPAEITRQIEKKIVAETGGARDIKVMKREVVLYDDGEGTMEPAVYVQAMLKYYRKDKDGKEQEYNIPYDFYQPLVKGSVAVFPHVKDQQLKVQPTQDIRQTGKDTLRKKDDE